jgi:hypothetical protein
MNKRASERVLSNIKVKFSCCHIDYDGVVTNISESGMFISTSGMNFPFESKLEILMSTGHRVLKIPIEVTRMIKSADLYDCIGVRLINPSQDYMEFVSNLHSST